MRTKLIEQRKRRGFTQVDMANKLKIARTTYTGYENGTFSPSFDKALEIKKILKTKSDEIFLNFDNRNTDKKEN